MVFIQSDNMEKSDSSLFGPEKLLDRGVVLVTFNYRIGILGSFLVQSIYFDVINFFQFCSFFFSLFKFTQ